MYPEYSISDYFCEMSMGKFDVVGDEVIVNLTETDTECQQMFGNREILNYYILKYKLDQEMNWDFSVYDNWSFNASTNEWVYEDDGYIDMIVMCYRNFPNGSYWAFEGASGWWNLATTFNVDGKTINGGFSEYGSGVTVTGGLMNYSNVTGAIQHEIFHYIMHSNNTYGNHGSSGLLTGLGEMSFCMNPWERTLNYINWVTPTTIQTTGIYDFTLSDYIKSGHVLKIPLPNTSGEEFYVVNSQRISMYDGIVRGGNENWQINKGQQNPYCSTGKGLYIYHHILIENSNFPLCDPQYDYYREFDLENAEGIFNWHKVRDVNYYIPGYNFTIPLFEPLAGDVFTGKEESHHWINIPNACMQKEVSDDPCNMNEDANDYMVTADDLGDEKDAFNFGIDEIFSPYSNPNTGNSQNPSQIIPLTIKITGYNSTNGDISLKVYYNNEIQAIQDLPPSKPKNIKVTKHIVDPITGRFKPKVTWDANREPDFEDGGIYKIYRGVQYICDAETEPTQYSLLGVVGAGTEEFIDHNIYLYPRTGGSGICEYQFRSLSYKVEAIDESDKPSLKSDRAIINGYVAPCDPIDAPVFTNNEIPVDFELHQNYPNPFNPKTEINFDLPTNTFVTVKIYNLLGEEIALLVKNEYKNAGRYAVIFDGSNLASGLYFYSIKAGSYKDVKKMVLIK